MNRALQEHRWHSQPVARYRVRGIGPGQHSPAAIGYLLAPP